jgi:hypothetical protein
MDANVIYVGTDDGNVQLTRDGGSTWTDLTPRIRGLPERTYVSRLVPSRFVEGRVYATFDGHRNDDYAPYAYVSEDYGQQWQAIVDGLPHGWSVNVIAEHPTNENLLLLGNEIGVYFSIERGAAWARLKNNLPTVPVDDIVIHPRDNDLVVGTHGRSIWIMDDITPLEQLSRELLAASAHVFPVRPATMYSLAGGWPFWHTVFTAPNPPVGATIRYFLRDQLTEQDAPVADESSSDGSGPNPQETNRRRTSQGEDEVKAKLVIVNSGGETVRELEGPGEPGIHEVIWDLRIEPPYEAQGGQGGFFRAPTGPRVLPGTYTVRLEAAGEVYSQPVEVLRDPRIEISDVDRLARQDALMSVYTLNKSLNQANRTVTRLSGQVSDIKSLIEQHEDAPETLAADAKALGDTLSEIRQALSEVSRDARVGGAIEGSTTRPTADQLWQIDRAWSKLPGLIERINEIINVALPALNQACDEHGIRPDPGQPIDVPRKPGGQ